MQWPTAKMNGHDDVLINSYTGYDADGQATAVQEGGFETLPACCPFSTAPVPGLLHFVSA